MKEKRTKRVAAVRQLRASGSVGETIERVLQVCVLDKRARVVRVGLVDHTAVSRSANVRAGRGLVVLGNGDANCDTGRDECNKGDERTDNLRSCSELSIGRGR